MDGTCTWAGCDSPAKHELGDRNGRQWAHLCDAHNEEMDRAVNSPQVGDIVRAWIKAQGGAKAAAERCMAGLSRIEMDPWIFRAMERSRKRG